MIDKVVVVYVEGDASLRAPMSKFLDPIRQTIKSRRTKLLIEVCGDIGRTRRAFERSLEKAKFLLVDSDGPASSVKGPHRHEMVETMESWFLADWETLRSHFNADKADPSKTRNIEQIPKKEVSSILADLASARRKKYHKTGDAPRLLEKIRLDIVRMRAPSCDRLCNALEDEASG